MFVFNVQSITIIHIIHLILKFNYLGNKPKEGQLDKNTFLGYLKD